MSDSVTDTSDTSDTTDADDLQSGTGEQQTGTGEQQRVPTEPVQEERISVASQRKLIWWRFRKHKLALIGAIVVVLFYFVAVFADFFAYSAPNAADGRRALIAPQSIDWFDGKGFNPHVHPLELKRDPTTLQVHYVED